MELFLEAMEQNEVFVRVLINQQGDLMITISAGWWVFECVVPDELTTRPWLSGEEQTLIVACTALLEAINDLYAALSLKLNLRQRHVSKWVCSYWIDYIRNRHSLS
jgi:hypothetical protein